MGTHISILAFALALHLSGAAAADLQRRDGQQQGGQQQGGQQQGGQQQGGQQREGPLPPKTDLVLCVAGCDSRVPVIVHERARAPGQVDPIPRRTQWEQVTWGVWCADGIGCRAIGNIPFSRHRGSYSSTIHVYVHRYPF